MSATTAWTSDLGTSSKRRIVTTSCPCLPSLILALLLVLGHTLGSPTFACSSSTTPIPLATAETWRDPGCAGQSALFTVAVEDRGILLVELSQSVSAPRAHLNLLTTTVSGPAEVLRHSPTVLLLRLAAGRYTLQVRADDALGALAPFHLQTRWVADNSDMADNSDTPKREDAGTAAIEGFGGLVQDTDKGENDSEIELEPEGLTAAQPISADLGEISQLSRDIKRALCRRHASDDDHADALLCAEVISPRGELRGRIGSPWGDDRDLFRFEVRALNVVQLHLSGTESRRRAGLVVEILDRFGMPVDVMTDDGDGVRWLRALVPGTYFVRLSGRYRMEGAYELRVKTNG